MNVKHILCPVDFSESSDLALDLASKLARESNAKLFIVHVEENAALVHPGLFAGPPPAAWRDHHRLTEVLPTATEVCFEHDLLLGDPATRIVEFAVERGVDLIVMGSHGLTGLARVLIGSVAETVVRRSTVPVLTLKPNAKNIATAPHTESSKS